MRGSWSPERRKKYELEMERKHELDVERAKELYDTEASDSERFRYKEFVMLLVHRMNISESYARTIVAMFERQYDTYLVKRKGLKRPPCTQEFRDHMREIKKGKPNNWTPEGRARFSEAVRSRQLGQKYTLSACGKRLGKTHLGDSAPIQLNINKTMSADIQV